MPMASRYSFRRCTVTHAAIAYRHPLRHHDMGFSAGSGAPRARRRSRALAGCQPLTVRPNCDAHAFRAEAHGGRASAGREEASTGARGNAAEAAPFVESKNLKIVERRKIGGEIGHDSPLDET